mmetsp:Transcript_33079/g.50744  ORF Transcript_33079/g.50744 Transcript_33079/m.50744 type:complete len:196 (-) Transcript_33079:126-713(-)
MGFILYYTIVIEEEYIMGSVDFTLRWIKLSIVLNLIVWGFAACFMSGRPLDYPTFVYSPIDGALPMMACDLAINTLRNPKSPIDICCPGMTAQKWHFWVLALAIMYLCTISDVMYAISFTAGTLVGVLFHYRVLFFLRTSECTINFCERMWPRVAGFRPSPMLRKKLGLPPVGYTQRMTNNADLEEPSPRHELLN